jgi:predicted porin
MLKAFAGYTDRRVQSTVDSNNTLTRTGYEIGVRSFITSKVEGWASGGMGRYNAPGVQGNTANLTGYQLGTNYWLSKRTNLYGIVGANNVAGTNVTALGGTTPKRDIFQYAVGVRHTF